MRKIIIVSLFLLVYSTTYPQLSTNETPVSFGQNLSNLRVGHSSFRTARLNVDLNTLQNEDRYDEENGIPPRFGQRLKVNYTIDNSGEWTDLLDGGKIWRLSINSPGAFVHKPLVRQILVARWREVVCI